MKIKLKLIITLIVILIITITTFLLINLNDKVEQKEAAISAKEIDSYIEISNDLEADKKKSMRFIENHLPTNYVGEIDFHSENTDENIDANQLFAEVLKSIQLEDFDTYASFFSLESIKKFFANENRGYINDVQFSKKIGDFKKGNEIEELAARKHSDGSYSLQIQLSDGSKGMETKASIESETLDNGERNITLKMDPFKLITLEKD